MRTLAQDLLAYWPLLLALGGIVVIIVRLAVAIGSLREEKRTMLTKLESVERGLAAHVNECARFPKSQLVEQMEREFFHIRELVDTRLNAVEKQIEQLVTLIRDGRGPAA